MKIKLEKRKIGRQLFRKTAAGTSETALNVFIKNLIEEGQTDGEIADAIVSSDKEEIAAESEGLQIEEAVEKAMKKAQIQRAILKKTQEQKALSDAQKAKKEEDEKINKAIDEKLKSINIDPSGKFRDVSTYKKFDFVLGKTVEVSKGATSESYKAFSKLLVAKALKDDSSARSISDEIDVDNDKKLGIDSDVKATLRTDSNSVGGYGIPTEVASEIQQMRYALSVMLPIVNRNVIMHNSKIFPTIGAMSVGYIASEDTQITETNPTMSNPTVTMKRFGGLTNVSNELITQSTIVSALQVAYADASARFLDQKIITGNITGASEPIDGLVWQGSTSGLSAITTEQLDMTKLMSILESINSEVDLSRVVWLGNLKIRNLLGKLETTGGQLIFPQYMSGGDISPLGIKYVTNTKIGSALQVSEDNNTGGSDDVLLLADMSKVVVGIEPGMRLDASEHKRFDYDQTQFRMLERWGMALLFADACKVQEINPAS